MFFRLRLWITEFFFRFNGDIKILFRGIGRFDDIFEVLNINFCGKINVIIFCKF